LIRKKRGLLLAGLLSAIAGIVVLFPVRVAYHWISSPFVQAAGLRGTVWAGSAREVLVAGIAVADVRWHFRPLRLFTGELAFHVEATPAAGYVDAEVGLATGQRLRLRDVRAALPLHLFEPALQVRGLAGSTSLTFEFIEIDNGIPVAMRGNAEVANLSVPMISREPIGGYHAEFFTQESGIVASVEDTDGVIDVAGSLELRPDRSYRFLAQVVAKPETPEKLREQMRFLPPANERGQQELRVEGSL